MKWLLMSVLICWAGLSLPALSQDAQSVGDEDLRVYLGALQLEARFDVDLTGDGRAELVYVAADHDIRVLGVIEGGTDRARLGASLLGEARLVPAPLSSVSLSIDEDQLLVEQFAGEGTVNVSNYRYRYDATVRQLRLLELSIELYSDVADQGTTRISWDLRSGDYVVVRSKPVTLDNGQDAYVYGPESRTIRSSAPVSLSDTPDPLALLRLEAKSGMLASSAGEH